MEQIKNNVQQLVTVLHSLDVQKIEELSKTIKHCIQNGGKILICGNGGSAAEADHFTTELVGRYLSSRRPLPCICLNISGSAMSCITNDYGGEYIFSRQVQALANKGDLLLVLTTSGKSKNIDKAIEQAKKTGVKTFALLGKDGGNTKNIVDDYYIIPSMETARVQEAHLFIIHCICDYLEGM